MNFPSSVKITKRRPLIENVAASPKPLLRSLPLAKECSHNQGVIGVKPCCGGCTYYKCDVKGEVRLPDCGTCNDWKAKEATPNNVANWPAEVVQALKVKHNVNPGFNWKPIRFDETNLAPEAGGQRLNPSIINYKDGYLFAYRNRWGNADVSVIRLTKDFIPLNQAKQLNLHHPDAKSGREDPRLFWHKDKLHVWFTGWHKKIAHNLFARINNETFKTECIFHPKIPNRNKWEKNLAFFDHKQETYCVYSIKPHRVLKVYCDTVEQIYETPTNTSWGYGHLRGGASPVLHNGEMIHFFHGMIDDNYYWRHGGAINPNGKRLYTMGAYAFEARPPFKITRMTQHPIEIADASTNPGNGPNVFFPNGAILDGNRWIISAGIHDSWSEIRFYDVKQIDAMMTKV